MSNIKEQILAIKPKTTEVPLPSCGLTVYVRPMSALAQLEFGEIAQRKAGTKEMIAKLIAECLCDENGNLLFPANEVDQVLSRLSTDDITKLTDACMERNGLNDVGKARLKKV